MSAFRSIVAGAAALVAVSAIPTIANAAVTTTTANLNLRTGPGTNHRIITTIPAGSRIDIHSCGHTWCHVSWNWHTGFVNGRYLVKHVTIPVSPLNHVHR